MSEMEEKLGSILGNPQLMQQIMTMAQSLGAPDAEETAPSPAPVSAPAVPAPGLDPAMLGALSQTGMDANQQSLLKALSPYISPQRSHKLEKAMRAAKLARAASGFLGAGGLSLLTGR